MAGQGLGDLARPNLEGRAGGDVHIDRMAAHRAGHAGDLAPGEGEADALLETGPVAQAAERKKIRHGPPH